MHIDSFKSLYLAELQEAHSIEAQLREAFPEMIRAASAEDLKQALSDHLDETRSHLVKVDEILHIHGVEAGKHRDQSMQKVLAETRKWADMIDDPACRDAALIASAQRVEHYEIAIYGTLSAWAKQLELDDDLGLLLEILEDETATDVRLTRLAEKVINPRAA